ncbi:hypothetical protein HDV00_012475 [Rhizophlyctis rosea]|nr:hypothetical protein HDV00_012475 [Rhizophlyctis rosea]
METTDLPEVMLSRVEKEMQNPEDVGLQGFWRDLHTALKSEMEKRGQDAEDNQEEEEVPLRRETLPRVTTHHQTGDRQDATKYNLSIASDVDAALSTQAEGTTSQEISGRKRKANDNIARQPRAKRPVASDTAIVSPSALLFQKFVLPNMQEDKHVHHALRRGPHESLGYHQAGPSFQSSSTSQNVCTSKSLHSPPVSPSLTPAPESDVNELRSTIQMLKRELIRTGEELAKVKRQRDYYMERWAGAEWNIKQLYEGKEDEERG